MNEKLADSQDKRSSIDWTYAVATYGVPVESSILTDEQWAEAKNQNRVVSILSDETGMAYTGRMGLLSDDVFCRVVFPSALPPGTSIKDVALGSIDWDFSRAARETTNATERLIVACNTGDSAALRLAISAGADINCIFDCNFNVWVRGKSKGEAYTPLKQVTLKGHRECVELLIQAKADFAEQKGTELWRLATLQEHSEIASLFESHGVKKVPQEAFIQAAHEGNKSAVINLIRSGIDLNKPASIWSPYHLQGTALNLAILAKRSDIIDLLLSSDVDAIQPDESGITPWIAAAASGQTDLCSKLESKGASMSPQAALVLASQIGNAEVIESLVQLGADPNARATIGRIEITPMEAAFASNEIRRAADTKEADDEKAKEALRCQVLAQLLTHGGDPNMRDEHGRPLLLRAVDMLKEDVISVLSKHGADVEITDEHGDTALGIAAKDVKTDCARKLLLAGANPNAVNREGQVIFTQLFNSWQLLNGWSVPSVLKFTKWLIAFGAQLDMKTKPGKTVRQSIKQAIRKAKKKKSDTETLTEISELLDDEESLNKFGCAFARDPESLEDCLKRSDCAIEWMKDGNLAFYELARAVEMDQEGLSCIVARLSNENWSRRMTAAMALAIIGPSVAGTAPQIACLLYDEEKCVVIAARTALSAIGFDAISGLLPEDEDSLEGESAIEAGKIHGALGDMHLDDENDEAALLEFQKSTQLNPDWDTGRWEMVAYLRKKKGDCSLSRALEFYAEGFYESSNGDFEAAEISYLKAIDESPDYPWGYNNLAWEKATCSDPDFRDGEAAVALAKQASDLTGNRYHGILDTLAAAYAETGNYEKAAEIAERALLLAPKDARPGYAFCLERYRSGQPWCEY